MSVDGPQIHVDEADRVLTASEISTLSGRSRKAIHRALADVPPDKTVSVGGNGALAWHVSKLPPWVRGEVDSYDLTALQNIIQQWNDPYSPSDAEAAKLLVAAFERLEDLCEQGANEQHIKGWQIAWMIKNAPRLARTPAALRLAYNRALHRWRTSGRRLSSLLDRRAAAAKAKRAPQLPTQDLKRLGAEAHYGGIQDAWQRCHHQLSEETRKRYPFKPGKQVPHRVRAQVQLYLDNTEDHHIGERYARARNLKTRRLYSNIKAGDIDQMDDKTVDAYTYTEEDPYTLFRPQLLINIDIKSGMVYNCELSASKQWLAVGALGLVRRKVGRFGGPRKGFYWENGKFRDCKYLGRGGLINVFTDERQNFADRLGVRIRHTNPGQPWAKIIERIIGVLTRKMSRLAGYVGKDEVHVKYDEVERAKKAVARRLIHPKDAGFLEIREMKERIEEMVQEYNETPRRSITYEEGDRLSPLAAFEKYHFSHSGEPAVFIPPDLEYLWAVHVEEVSVTKTAGITMFKRRYYGPGTTDLIGQRVRAYFDPEKPERIHITDLDGNNVRVVEEETRSIGWAETEEEKAQTAKALAQATEHNKHSRQLYFEVKNSFIPPDRKVHVSPSVFKQAKDRKRVTEEYDERKRVLTKQQAEKKKTPHLDRFWRKQAAKKAAVCDGLLGDNPTEARN